MSACRSLIERMSRISTATIATLALVAGCGEEQRDDNAVEAREQNTVELGGVRYRIVLFRQLNVHTVPDDALWGGSPPPAGRGLYMVVVRACAAADDVRPMTEHIHLEDAFGQRFAPEPAETADRFEYSAAKLEPGACRPVPGSAADRTFDGGALVFQVPFDSTAERPMMLEMQDPTGAGEARIQVDL
jgi:hypothetical protein